MRSDLIPRSMLPQLLAVSERTLARLPLPSGTSDGLYSWPLVCQALSLPTLRIVSGRALMRPTEAAWALSCSTRSIRTYSTSGLLKRLHIAQHPRLARVTAETVRTLWKDRHAAH